MSFTSLFYQHIMFRRSCEVCHYTNLQRPSDITLADFWGWEKTVPDFNTDDKGVSLVFCNTKKGQALFDAVKDRMKTQQVNLTDTLQPNLQHPTVAHPKRQKFEKLYAKKGFNVAYIKRQSSTLKKFVDRITHISSFLLKRILKGYE